MGALPPGAAVLAASARGRVLNRWAVLAILTAVFVINYVDRQLVAIVLPQIKREFAVSDTALGLLTGPTFAIVYGVFGIPLGILADRHGRGRVIAACLFVFSVMTVLSGVAARFWHLLAARVGTGIGEAGTSPAAISLIADRFGPEDQTRALGIYTLGANLGVLAAFVGGGLVAQALGWRTALMTAGVAGLVLVPLVMLARMDVAPRSGRGLVKPGAGATFKSLAREPAFRWIAIGAALNAFGSTAILAFAPLGLARSHGLDTGQLGVTMAFIAGPIGGGGVVLVSVLANRLARSDVRWTCRICAATSLASALCMIGFSAGGGLAPAVASLGLYAFFGGAVLSLYLSTLNLLAPAGERAQASAILLLIVNLSGAALGPLAVGAISDGLTSRFGDESIRIALSGAAVFLLLSGLAFARVARFLPARPMGR